MPGTPGELAVWLGCIGMEVGVLLSTFKSEVPSVVDLDFKTLYLPLLKVEGVWILKLTGRKSALCCTGV